MAITRYTIFCDESVGRGALYSNFYGGSLTNTSRLNDIETILLEKKEELGMKGELKWTKISSAYEERYIRFVDAYFDLVRDGFIKVRVMFSNNNVVPVGLTSKQQDNRYFLLYYQLIKHAFGLVYSDEISQAGAEIHLLLDDLPDTKAKVHEFRQHVSNIMNTSFYSGSNIRFPLDQIVGVNSKLHVVLQGLDIILGSMQFKLNKLHQVKPEGAARRGARTIAKERVYKHINRRIREIYPNFNIALTTGTNGRLESYWEHPYRHWVFQPRNSERQVK